VTILGFRTPEAAPEGAILLMLSDDDAAEHAGQGLYLELGEQSRGGYGLVSMFRGDGSGRVVMGLTAAGCTLLGTSEVSLSAVSAEAMAGMKEIASRSQVPFECGS
jgi:hypothetical protein